MTFLTQKFSGGYSKVPWATEKESFTPTVTTWDAYGTWTGHKWRVGNMLFMEIQCNITSGTSGLCYITLPDSLSYDTSVISETNIYDTFFATVYYRLGSNGYSGGVLQRDSTSTTRFLLGHENPTTGITAAIGTSEPSTWANGDHITIRACFPIAGWNVERNLTPRGSTFRGALVRLPAASANQTISTATWTAVGYDDELYDTDSFHDTVTNNTRLTVPNGVSRVRLQACILWSSTATGRRIATFYKNGAEFAGMGRTAVMPQDGSSNNIGSHNLTSAVVTCTSGDYFECYVYQDSGGDSSIDSSDTANWFAIEVIE